jgi:hypothetical protein
MSGDTGKESALLPGLDSSHSSRFDGGSDGGSRGCWCNSMQICIMPRACVILWLQPRLHALHRWVARYITTAGSNQTNRIEDGTRQKAHLQQHSGVQLANTNTGCAASPTTSSMKRGPAAEADTRSPIQCINSGPMTQLKTRPSFFECIFKRHLHRSDQLTPKSITTPSLHTYSELSTSCIQSMFGAGRSLTDTSPTMVLRYLLTAAAPLCHHMRMVQCQTTAIHYSIID